MSQRLHQHLRMNMSKHCRVYSPRMPSCLHLFSGQLLYFLSINCFMQSTLDVTSSQVLQLTTGLNEQVSRRYSYLQLLSIRQPDIQTWISASSVNRQESVVIVKPDKGLSRVASCQVEAIRSEFVGSSFQFVGKAAFGEAEAYFKHFCESKAELKGMIPPVIQDALKFWEIFGRFILLLSLAVSYIPKVPHSSGRSRRERRKRLIFLRELVQFIAIIIEDDDPWGRQAYIVVVLFVDIWQLSSVYLLLPLHIVLFHHVYQSSILLLADSRVFYDDASELSKSFCYLVAILGRLTSSKEIIETYLRYIFEDSAKGVSDQPSQHYDNYINLNYNYGKSKFKSPFDADLIFRSISESLLFLLNEYSSQSLYSHQARYLYEPQKQIVKRKA